MRYMIMSFSVLVMLLSQDLFASAKTDSIVAFLGGTHAKFVWQRWAWCNENYTPKTKAAATAEGMSLMLMDTRTGTERTLLSGQSLGIFFVRISRSGKWATFVDGSAKKTYIVDLTASSPARKVLLDGNAGTSYWQAGAWWIDPASGTEYVYALGGIIKDGDAIYKVKVNADGTAALPGTKLTINSSARIDGTFSVSADGKKLGGAFPWPDTYILDIPTGRLDSRHHAGEVFGCQPNIAPDNSYRFFHCQGDHQGIYMFAANMVNTNWFVNLSINLAGVPNPNGSTAMDFLSPRWTNHVQYYTAQCPMGDNNESYCSDPANSVDGCYMDEGGSLWNKTADQVKNQLNMLKVPRFFMGKFSADFKSQEKSIAIALDPRHMQYQGDAWICDGINDGNACTSTASSNVIRTGGASKTRIQRTGSSVIIPTGSAPSSVIRISDARGRVVRTWAGSGTCALDAQDLTPGAYLVSVTAGARSETMRLPLATR